MRVDEDWQRITIPSRPDIIGTRIRPDGRREYRVYLGPATGIYYTAVEMETQEEKANG